VNEGRPGAKARGRLQVRRRLRTTTGRPLSRRHADAASRLLKRATSIRFGMLSMQQRRDYHDIAQSRASHSPSETVHPVDRALVRCAAGLLDDARRLHRRARRPRSWRLVVAPSRLTTASRFRGGGRRIRRPDAMSAVICACRLLRPPLPVGPHTRRPPHPSAATRVWGHGTHRQYGSQRLNRCNAAQDPPLRPMRPSARGRPSC
jgi:hypothetical protein